MSFIKNYILEMMEKDPEFAFCYELYENNPDISDEEVDARWRKYCEENGIKIEERKMTKWEEQTKEYQEKILECCQIKTEEEKYFDDGGIHNYNYYVLEKFDNKYNFTSIILPDDIEKRLSTLVSNYELGKVHNLNLLDAYDTIRLEEYVKGKGKVYNTTGVKMKETCCFTGPRPKNYPKEYSVNTFERYIKEQLENEISTAIKNGYKNFITGMAMGVDMIAAEIVLSKKATNPDLGLKLICAIPNRFQTEKWSNAEKVKYQDILNIADKVIYISDEFSVESFHERNKYMVDNSSLLIAVDVNSNGARKTIEYAKEKYKNIKVIKVGEK